MRQQHKKSKFVALLLSLLLVCTMMPQLAWATGGTLTGDGTADNPYQISDAEDLKAFRDEVNGGKRTAYAILTQNIDLKGEEWTPFAPTTGKVADAFGGTFDGNGKTISGLSVSGDGFFAVVNGAEIKNLTLQGTVSGSSASVGGIVGKTQGSVKITNCAFEGNVTSTNTGTTSGTAGIVGKVNSGNVTITGCVNNASINGNSNAAGIIGYLSASGTTISESYNTGKITASRNIGGIAGQVHRTTQISNCYNIGTISRTATNKSGICGLNGALSNCYYLDNSLETEAKGQKAPINKDTLLHDLKSSAFTADTKINNGYPILKWQTGAKPEPAKPGIRIESSSGSSIWTVAGGKNQTSSTTLSVAYDNMGEAKPNVTWVYPAESDAAVISVSTTDQNKLIVDAAGKKGGVLDITAKVTYNNEKYTQTLKLTVIPNITKVQIKNVDDGAVAVGQTVKAKVNVKGGRAYDETTMPPLTYQWYQRNSLSTSGTGTLVAASEPTSWLSAYLHIVFHLT